MLRGHVIIHMIVCDPFDACARTTNTFNNFTYCNNLVWYENRNFICIVKLSWMHYFV